MSQRFRQDFRLLVRLALDKLECYELFRQDIGRFLARRYRLNYASRQKGGYFSGLRPWLEWLAVKQA